MIHRRAQYRLKAKDLTRKCEIQDLEGAVVEQHRERYPAIEHYKVAGTGVTLPIEIMIRWGRPEHLLPDPP